MARRAGPRLANRTRPTASRSSFIPSPVTAETRWTFTGFFRRPRSFASFSPPARASGTSIFVTATICGFFASSGE